MRAIGPLLGFLLASAAWAEIPDVLYHYGQYDVLMKNVEARTVPQEDWDRFIMGDRTRYQQKWYRRGLYGSSHPGYAAWFMDIRKPGQEPWFMAIRMTESCRKTPSYNMAKLFADPRVINYFETRKPNEYKSIDDYRDQCFDSITESGVQYWHMKVETMAGREAWTDCEKFVNRLFDGLHAQVIEDMSWDESWYIRDRDCIESIQGTPVEVIEMISSIPGYGSEVLPNGNKRTPTMNANSSQPLIILKALIEAAVLEPKQLARFDRALAEFDLINPSFWRPDVNTTKPHWVADQTRLLVKGYRRCLKSGRIEAWKTHARGVYERLVKLSFSEYDAAIEKTFGQNFCER